MSKVTIYGAYRRDGHFCCWHHDVDVASASADRGGGFVKRLTVTAFDWPHEGPARSEIPMRVTPPNSVDGAGVCCIFVRGKEHPLAIKRWRAKSGS